MSKQVMVDSRRGIVGVLDVKAPKISMIQKILCQNLSGSYFTSESY